MTEGCGLKDCHCQSLLTTVHPQGDFRDFPYLERGDLSEEGFSLLSSRLQRQYEEMVFAFQQLIPKTLSIVHENKIAPEVIYKAEAMKGLLCVGVMILGTIGFVLITESFQMTTNMMGLLCEGVMIWVPLDLSH